MVDAVDLINEIVNRRQYGDHPSRHMCREDWDAWIDSNEGLVEILKCAWLATRPPGQRTRDEQALYDEEKKLSSLTTQILKKLGRAKDRK